MLVVMSASGAGKTTLLKAVNEKRPGVKIINYGDLAAKALNTTNDKVLSFPAPKIEEMQEKVVDMLKEEKHPQIILTTHASLPLTSGEILPGFHARFFKDVKVEGLAYIDAPSDDILKRREAQHAERPRALVPKEEIERERKTSMDYIRKWSEEHSVPYFVIMNPQNDEGYPTEAVNDFLQLLDKLGWAEEAEQKV